MPSLKSNLTSPPSIRLVANLLEHSILGGINCFPKVGLRLLVDLQAAPVALILCLHTVSPSQVEPASTTQQEPHEAVAQLQAQCNGGGCQCWWMSIQHARMPIEAFDVLQRSCLLLVADHAAGDYMAC